MNTRHVYVAGAFILAIVGGCASAPVMQQEQTAQKLSQTTNDMQSARTQIDKTLASLQQLMSAPPTEMRSAFERYSQDVSAISAEANRMQDRSEEVTERSTRWLSEWQKSQGEIQNPELREISQQRRSAIMSRLDNTNTAFSTAQQSLTPFVENLEDIKTAVGSDLTPRGIESVKRAAVVRNADTNGQNAARAMDRAISELRSLDTALSSVEQAPTGTGSGY